MEQNRFKSWALWLSIAALVIYVVKISTGYDLDELSNLLLPVLVGFGIINNPTDQKHI